MKGLTLRAAFQGEINERYQMKRLTLSKMRNLFKLILASSDLTGKREGNLSSSRFVGRFRIIIAVNNPVDARRICAPCETLNVIPVISYSNAHADQSSSSIPKL